MIKIKKGYKKLIVFESILFLILIINSFVWNILSSYIMIAFLVGVSIVFHKMFVFEKNRQRYIKDVIMDTVIFLLIFFILFYIFGIFIGFARTENYYTFLGFKNFVIPAILFIVIKEILRNGMIRKASGNKLAIVLTVILFILFDVTNAIYVNKLSSAYGVFIFLALDLLPAITSNVMCSYVSYKASYKPVVLYLLIMRLYAYLLPIIPNLNEYLVSIITFITPVVYMYQRYKYFASYEYKDVDRDYNKGNYVLLAITSCLTIVLVYLTSGYFKYYAVAIASGSMEPNIRKGDVVIVEKIGNKFDRLDEGMVIAFKYNNVIVVHRLIDIVHDNNEYYFYTKGDNNAKPDGYVVEENMVIGIVNIKIPFVGLPTVWLNEMWED